MKQKKRIIKKPLKITQFVNSFLIVIIIVFFPFTCFAKSKAKSGFMDFNLYYDTERFTTLTVNAFAKLPNRFSYFSLTNYFNSLDADDLTDSESFYSEQNLRWALPDKIPLDLTIQWNIRSGKRNDRLRLGTRWNVNKTSGFDEFLKKLNITYSINFHLFQIDFEDEYVWQMEHVYRIMIFPKILNNRVYIAGFGDHSIGGINDPAWVTEHQLGINLVDNLHFVTEYRFNEYRKGDESSLGLGLEYIIKF